MDSIERAKKSAREGAKNSSPSKGAPQKKLQEMNVLGVRRSDGRGGRCIRGRWILLGHGLAAVDLLLLLAKLGQPLAGAITAVIGQGCGGGSTD